MAKAGKKTKWEQDLPVKKNEVHETEIIGMGHSGEGVGRVHGFTLFIPGAIPGEKVRFKVLKVKKQYGYGKLLEVLSPSPDRTAAPCPVYRQCGGCQLQHMAYDAQLRWKRRRVIDNLERIGKLRVAGEENAGVGSEDGTFASESAPAASRTFNSEMPELPLQEADHIFGDHIFGGKRAAGPVRQDQGIPAADLVRQDADEFQQAEPIRRHAVIVHPTIGMDNPWRYRNKSQVPIGAAEGGLIGGFYAQNSHRIIDMEGCLIQHEHNDDAVRAVKETAQLLGISAYDEVQHRGLLRHVVVKKAFRTGEMMVVLVTNGQNIPHCAEWVQLIRERLPAVVSICQNINTARTNVIFGEQTNVLWGRDVIYDEIGGIRFAISARSFYQVNPAQTEVLYSKALEYAKLTGKETVIDAYCGIGTISLFLARHAAKVYGVEVVEEAVRDAGLNARLNGIRNVEFAAGAAEEIIPRWKEEGVSADVIVVDPPRKGCDEKLLQTMIEMRPRRIVYVSCNPATLARDLRILEDGGFRTVEVQPVDMFPHTVHVECCASLVRDS
jgi:23S rRNA (uracil1939-C5)-methyltransferase